LFMRHSGYGKKNSLEIIKLNSYVKK
jgi:hypothetical protein